MIIARTPLRISFLGGGTDYPDYFKVHGGQTLGVAINKYSYVMVKPLAAVFDYALRVAYSRTELVQTLDEIEHPAVRECLRFLKIERGVEIDYVGDLPARTGLGSSSSFTVGLLHALHAFKGEFVPRGQLAAEAVHVEQDLIRERVGVQDQHLCCHGGLAHVQINRDGTVSINRMPLAADRWLALEQRLALFYTGLRRHAHEVVREQLERTKNGANSQDLSYLSGLVDQGVAVLGGRKPLSEFGELLHAAWTAKQRLSGQISNAHINDWYERARRAGAVGGKLLGAGGGGFLLFYVEPDKRGAVRSALSELAEVAFKFEPQGSTIIFDNPG